VKANGVSAFELSSRYNYFTFIQWD